MALMIYYCRLKDSLLYLIFKAVSPLLSNDYFSFTAYIKN